MRQEGYVVHKGKMRNVNNILVVKTQGKNQLGRPKHRSEYNIKWILWKQSGKECIGFLWLRIWTLMNTVMRHFKFHDRQRIS
jgi:hypothetical protein